MPRVIPKNDKGKKYDPRKFEALRKGLAKFGIGIRAVDCIHDSIWISRVPFRANGKLKAPAAYHGKSYIPLDIELNPRDPPRESRGQAWVRRLLYCIVD